jgi:hypothetical protein
MPGGLGEPIHLRGLRYRAAMVDFRASGQGVWPRQLLLDGQPLVGTTRLPPLAPGAHAVVAEYGPTEPAHPVLTLAVDAQVSHATIAGETLTARLTGEGYTPIAFYSPGPPEVTLAGTRLPVEWDATTGRGRARAVLTGSAQLTIASGG